MDIIRFILEHAAKEWALIKGAPSTAFILLASDFVLLLVAFKWRYAGQIESLAGQNNLLRDQVADYRERLGLAPPDKTAYSKLTNREVKKAVADFVSKLRNFADRAEGSNHNRRDPFRNEIRIAAEQSKTDAERQEIYRKSMDHYMQDSIAWHRAVEVEYQRDYKSLALISRDEMLNRLPPQSQPPMRFIIYEALAGPSPLEDIITDLQRLAALLPDRPILG